MEFYHGGARYDACVESSLWRDPAKEDIAFLTYSGDLPPGVASVGWGLDAATSNDPCVTFGYPDIDLANGLWAHAIISGPVSGIDGLRLIQLRSSEITTGFSGAPLFNQRTRLVVGMVSAITIPDAFERLKETAFVVSSEVLLSMCPLLRNRAIASLETVASGPVHRQRIRLEGMQKQWDLAYDKLSRLERALTLESRVDERMRLEYEVAEARRRLQVIEEELDGIESPK